MKFSDLVDPTSLKSSEAVVIAVSQQQGGRIRQEDYFSRYHDECVVVADGVGGMPHGDVAAALAGETAIWGYKQIRQHHFYWRDKKLLLKRIFRTANIAVCQKQKDEGFSDGLATTLVVAIFGESAFWLGSVGDTGSYLIREGLILPLTLPDINNEGRLEKALGLERYGLTANIVKEKFIQGDVLLIATDGVMQYIEEEEIRAIVEHTEGTTKSLEQATTALLSTAKSHGSTDNMTACLIQKPPIAQKD